MNVSRENDDLQTAKSVTIGYTLEGQRKELVLAEQPAVEDLLRTIDITKTEKGLQVGLKPKGTVQFLLADNRKVETMFVEATRLDRAYWGQIHLRRPFFDRVCELVSRAEGRPIDVLMNN